MFVLLKLTVLLAISVQVFGRCGYQVCPASKPHMINVHLVPHSHNDVGWLKTFDEYYYGTRNSTQRAGVANILDTVVQELLKNPSRRFVYAELAFFFKWFYDQPETVKYNVRKLVNEGRLEFVGGGWSSNDEATVHYQSVIDQYTLGLQELSRVFGLCARPRVGWQIDAFGHSNEMASIFAQIGYDGQFFARVDWLEKSARMANLNGEMIWKSSESLAERSDIFTSILYNHYSAPPGFCFDASCVDQPIVDGYSNHNNVNERIDDFIAYVTRITEKYRTTDLLVPMGDDFNYENALINFKNMDKLIQYTNQRQSNASRINVFYSTPSCYLNALHEKNSSWPVKKQDFFPYSTDPNSYWTGFYSSRPTLKRLEREANHFLQVVQQLAALAKVPDGDLLGNIDELRQTLGLMQHHSAITGTQKQYVADDYIRSLSEAIDAGQQTARVALQRLTNLTHGAFQSCAQLNISICEATGLPGTNLVVTVFNPLAHISTQYIRLPLKKNTYVVLDAQNREVPSQVIPVPKQVYALPYRPKATDAELVFQATVNKLANYYVKTVNQQRGYVVDSQGFIDVVPAHLNRYRYRKATRNSKAIRRASKGLAETVIQASEIVDPVVPTVAVSSAGTTTTTTKTTTKTTTTTTTTTATTTTAKNTPYSENDIILENSLIKLQFAKTGHLTRIEMNGIAIMVRQDFLYYEAAQGTNWPARHRSSGAYVFRPNSTETPVGSQVYSVVYEGELVKEVHQRFNEWISQVVRIYKDINRVEFEWMVGPIPIKDGIGKDVVIRFSTDMITNGVFWTDSNGREMLRRVRNRREYYTPDLNETISANFYPVTTRIVLENEQKRFAVLTDRAQGGSSVHNGQVELMVHRRLLHDDGFGVDEALNETAFKNGLIARGKLYAMLGSAIQKPSYYERLAQKEIHLPVWKFFSNSSRQVKIAPVVDASYIPREIELLTLEPFSINQYLLRLENIMDRNETAPVTLNIRSIFDGLGGLEIQETTLDGNLPLRQMKRFKFSAYGEPDTKPAFYYSKHLPLEAKKKDPSIDFLITLDPMQIRTFLIRWQ